MFHDKVRKCVTFGIWKCLVVASLVGIASTPVGAMECPINYDFDGALDYYDPTPQVQARIRGFESNHMNQDVRALRRGQTTTYASGDLKFVINLVPNHAEALTLLMRMALRDRNDAFRDIAPYTVECWLHRATVFSPKDSNALMVYGVYLGRRGKPAEAIAVLERADALQPGDANISYNLGLMYFDRRDYARSREYAKRAYEAGFPLPGLKDKLRQAGQWSD